MIKSHRTNLTKVIADFENLGVFIVEAFFFKLESLQFAKSLWKSSKKS